MGADVEAGIWSRYMGIPQVDFMCTKKTKSCLYLVLNLAIGVSLGKSNNVQPSSLSYGLVFWYDSKGHKSYWHYWLEWMRLNKVESHKLEPFSGSPLLKKLAKDPPQKKEMKILRRSWEQMANWHPIETNGHPQCRTYVSCLNTRRIRHVTWHQWKYTVQDGEIQL